jgi:hypothetical protein
MRRDSISSRFRRQALEGRCGEAESDAGADAKEVADAGVKDGRAAWDAP